MQPITWLVLAAVTATILSLASGMLSMIRDGEVAHYGSAQWMGWRVGFQALAVVLILLALQGSS
ncbi:MAG TPA: twin transmembrane helix small protein [Usitatibacter sp.]|nr:twin transmembrane helix small protein [Usitatibacter sp.]